MYALLVRISVFLSFCFGVFRHSYRLNSGLMRNEKLSPLSRTIHTYIENAPIEPLSSCDYQHGFFSFGSFINGKTERERDRVHPYTQTNTEKCVLLCVYVCVCIGNVNWEA